MKTMNTTPTTTKIERFPADKLEDARDALRKSWERLCRAATKTGQAAPAAPELIVARTYVLSRCAACRITVEGFPPANHKHLDNWTSAEFVDLEVTADRPKLAGWEFLAAVEPLDGGNLIRQVPGAVVADGELLPWRAGTIACDHCKAARRRAETFIVRATGEDPAIPAGTYKQVGRQCLAAFLGGRSAASIVAMLAWADMVRGAAGEEDEGGGWFGRAPIVHDPIVFLTWVAASIREDGWISRGAARAYSDAAGGEATKRATADHAMYLMVPPFGGGRSAQLWNEERARCESTEVETERATAALAWARALEGASDYERNLSLVARQNTMNPKHAGLLASAISGYMRALGREMERKARDAKNAANPSAHIGEVGKRIGLDLLVERVIQTATDFGALNIIVMRDVANNLFVWKTGAADVQPGARLRLRGTAKKHTEFRGQKQTELSRCDVLECITGAATDFSTIQSAPPSDKPARAKRSKKTAVESESSVETARGETPVARP